MKIDLSTIDRNSFYVNEHIWNGELFYLVNPKELGVEWNHTNKIFRSSVWNSDGELISASFPKFVNWGEKLEIFPVPTSLDGATIVEKLDGSTLIVSKYKGNYMIRTRGTIDASNMELNGQEIEIFKNEVLPRVNWISYDMRLKNDTWPTSVIFEWTSPFNKIVLDYGNKPQFFLIGTIEHNDYSIWSQSDLDRKAYYCSLKRPATYTFGDIKDLLANIEKWTGKEGVCVYHKGGQEIHKVKSFEYLKLHRFKSNATLNNTLDMFFEFNCPTYTEFEAKLVNTFDWECFKMVELYAKEICDVYKVVCRDIDALKQDIEPLKALPRKDAAMAIIQKYPNEKSLCFSLLDNKVIDDKTMKKLMLDKLNYPLIP